MDDYGWRTMQYVVFIVCYVNAKEDSEVQRTKISALLAISESH